MVVKSELELKVEKRGRKREARADFLENSLLLGYGGRVLGGGWIETRGCGRWRPCQVGY